MLYSLVNGWTHFTSSCLFTVDVHLTTNLLGRKGTTHAMRPDHYMYIHTYTRMYIHT